jgi:hypothetical protein
MRRHLRSPAGLLAAFLLAVGTLTGCGSSSSGNGVAAKTPDQIIAAAKVLADAASSVHVSGSIVSSGTQITLDLDLVTGKGGRGRLSENGLSFELVQIHGTAYIKGSPAFYTHVAGPAAAQLLQGRWLKAPASSGNLASLASLTDLRQLLDTTLAGHGTGLRKGAITTVNGQKALAVTDTSTGGTLYVATTGPPYPIEVTKGGTGGGKIVFDRWNQPVSVTAPANAIDITQLQSKH